MTRDTTAQIFNGCDNNYRFAVAYFERTNTGSYEQIKFFRTIGAAQREMDLIPHINNKTLHSPKLHIR